MNTTAIAVAALGVSLLALARRSSSPAPAPSCPAPEKAKDEVSWEAIRKSGWRTSFNLPLDPNVVALAKQAAELPPPVPLPPPPKPVYGQTLYDDLAMRNRAHARWLEIQQWVKGGPF
jgi:hypothetical protein